MSQPKPDNGASFVIDALLMRMSELDRFSNDERVIAERALLPLDVVVNDEGEGAAARAYLAKYFGGKKCF